MQSPFRSLPCWNGPALKHYRTAGVQDDRQGGKLQANRLSGQSVAHYRNGARPSAATPSLCRGPFIIWMMESFPRISSPRWHRRLGWTLAQTRHRPGEALDRVWRNDLRAEIAVSFSTILPTRMGCYRSWNSAKAKESENGSTIRQGFGKLVQGRKLRGRAVIVSAAKAARLTERAHSHTPHDTGLLHSSMVVCPTPHIPAQSPVRMDIFHPS
jgi:hypothetical protein